MPTDITTRALPNGTLVVTLNFLDEDNNPVTPDDPTQWSLYDTAGNVINSKVDQDISENTTVDVDLVGDDLAATGANDDGLRLFKVVGTYASQTKNIDNSALFVVDTLRPVSLQEAKRHLRIMHDNTDHDIYLCHAITAAREKVESLTRRRFITQSFKAYLINWPTGDEIILPYGKLQSVASVKYYDTDDTEATFSNTLYRVETEREPGRIVLNYAESWPTTTLRPSMPIEVEFTCGYGPDSGDVPSMLRHAIKLAVSDIFENREPFFVGQGFTMTKTGMIERFVIPKKLWGSHHASGVIAA